MDYLGFTEAWYAMVRLRITRKRFFFFLSMSMPISIWPDLMGKHQLLAWGLENRAITCTFASNYNILLHYYNGLIYAISTLLSLLCILAI